MKHAITAANNEAKVIRRRQRLESFP